MYPGILKKWQKRLLWACFTLALASCGDSGRKIRLQDMDQGNIHFASSLILEDIIRKNSASPYFHLSPAHVLNPYQTLQAKTVMDDFRRDFTRAENAYYPLRQTGMLVQGTITDIDKDRMEVVFAHVDASARPPFSGKLRLSLDRRFYEKEHIPVLRTGTTSTFMCQEFRPIQESRNQAQHQIEVRLIECKTAEAYYATLHQNIQTRLKAIFSGMETVGADLAPRLTALYQAGQSLPHDSVCLSGSFVACHENLADELGRKWTETQSVDTGSMSIGQDNAQTRPPEQTELGATPLPANAGQSPSGNRLGEPSSKVQEQREMMSQTRIPIKR